MQAIMTSFTDAQAVKAPEPEALQSGEPFSGRKRPGF